MELLTNRTQILSSYASIVTIISFPLLLLGGYVAYLQIIEKIELPDAALEFINTSVIVRNVSNKVMYDPTYQIILWNIDEPMSKRLQPLPIKGNIGSYIRVGGYWGPTIFLVREARKRVNNGNRLLGWASVTCPKCSRQRWYSVFLKYNEGGWYSELPLEKFPKLSQIPELLRSPEKAARAFHNTFPEEQRIKIKKY